ncbi:MAG: hypothetical protein C5B57_07200 [Blastocatellia bacterium]|nr:MAG: hypothetical protein C5B57_07200 [Blastocatellia bacterium]
MDAPLSGESRDPLVGRDLLIGCAAGVGLLVMIRLGEIAPLRFGYPRPTRPSRTGTRSTTPAPSSGALIGQLNAGIIGGLVSLFVLFFLRVLTRHDLAAAVLFVLLIGALFLTTVTFSSAMSRTFWLDSGLSNGLFRFRSSEMSLFPSTRPDCDGGL